jgi:mRNA interferase MazF
MGSRRDLRPAQGKIGFPRRGDVFLVTFDPTIGAEIRKTRPAVVIQNDVGNRAGSTTIVAAITSQVKSPLYPFEVLVPSGEGGLGKSSVVLLNQIRTIDRARLVRRLGALRRETMARVDEALIVSLGLVEL